MSLELANMYIERGQPEGELDYDDLLDYWAEKIKELEEQVEELENRHEEDNQDCIDLENKLARAEAMTDEIVQEIKDEIERRQAKGHKSLGKKGCLNRIIKLQDYFKVEL